MSEVKRYMTTCDCMSEANWGDYVRHADYDALEAECERLRESHNDASHYAARCEEMRTERDAALAELEITKAQRDAALDSNAGLAGIIEQQTDELVALKGGREAVAWKVIGTNPKHRHPHIAIEFSEKLAEGQAAHWRNRGCTTEVIPLYTAPPAQASAWVPDAWRRAVYEAEECLTGCCASPGIADKIDVETVGKIIAHLQETRFAMLAAAPTPGASDGKEGG